MKEKIKENLTPETGDYKAVSFGLIYLICFDEYESSDTPNAVLNVPNVLDVYRLNYYVLLDT